MLSVVAITVCMGKLLTILNAIAKRSIFCAGY